MIFDAEQREDSWFRDQTFDVCVVGSGPAGISLARKLARHGRTVGLFEGGGENPTTESAALYKGNIVGIDYPNLDGARLRYFGGTSNHWAGACRPLDSFDFIPQAANPHSGWPIAKSDIDGYAAETDEILDLKPPAFERAAMDLSPLRQIFFRFSLPTRFRTKYEEELRQSTKIRMYLNANLVGIGVNDSRRRIAEFRFRSFARDDIFTVKATQFVLCLGGIENPRTLLNTESSDQPALGNQYGLVGRYFCEHPSFTLGLVLFKDRMAGVNFLGPQPEALSRDGILNFGLELDRVADPPESYLRDLGCSLSMTRKLAKMLGAPLQCTPVARLKISSEQALNPDSRVRLIPETDEFGLRRVSLNWRLSDVDVRTVRFAGLQCGRVFANLDVARVKLDDWLLDPAKDYPKTGRWHLNPAFHHMCTTRMSSDPARGVVDANCCIHGMDNIHIGGSSVFSTGGCSNPTYTIVQLALRLADHLNDRLG